MDALEFAVRVTDNLPYEPTGQQLQLIAALSRFCSPNAMSNGVFLLNGYAGTGKTSVTGALVKTLREIGVSSVLLAPTGRAAKVFSAFSRHRAFTIHRKIYRPPSPGSTIAAVNSNRHKATMFIVDEASMIGNGTDNGPDILEDLILYVYSGEGCKLILLGDTAQLPPVGTSESPAMNPEVLNAMGLKVTRVTMTETVRQSRDSGILYNATMLRRAMKMTPLPMPSLTVTPFDDVEAVDPVDLEDIMGSAYSRDGIEDTILVTRSNRRAVDFNLAIRSRILDKEEELSKGELLLIAKNNYFWTSQVKEIDFIANGDVARVVAIYGTENRGMIRFADVRLHFPDRDVEIDVKIILDSLTSESAGLSPEKSNALLNVCFNDPDKFAPDTPADTRRRALKTDPWFNALQVKYAYAVTCHKSQGGQWKNVFVDMGYIPEEAYRTLDFYRWLYTASTRATKKLYFINPSVEII